jgi:hypothetical protein
VTRSRQRGRRPQQSTHTHNPNRTFDSSGPEIKIRGSAAHVYEKYLQLARDANSAGDRVTAENYLQHAEHYYRIMDANQSQYQQQQQQQQQPQQPYQGQNRGPNPQYNGGNGRAANQGGDAMPQPGSGPSFSLADSGQPMDEEPDEADLA